MRIEAHSLLKVCHTHSYTGVLSESHACGMEVHMRSMYVIQ